MGKKRRKRISQGKPSTKDANIRLSGTEALRVGDIVMADGLLRGGFLAPGTITSLNKDRHGSIMANISPLGSPARVYKCHVSCISHVLMPLTRPREFGFWSVEDAAKERIKAPHRDRLWTIWGPGRYREFTMACGIPRRGDGRFERRGRLLHKFKARSFADAERKMERFLDEYRATLKKNRTHRHRA